MSWMDMVNDMTEEEAVQSGGGDYGVIPDGWYEVTTDRAEEKSTKGKNGHYLSVTFTIISDSYKNRKIWGNYNVDNPSAIAQQIGVGQLKRMMLAAGVAKMEDIADLNDRTLWIKIGTDKREADRNEIKAYRATEPDTDEGEDKPSAKAEKPAAAAAKKSPWKK